MTNSPSDKLRGIFLVPGWARFTSELRSLRDAGRPFPAAITLAAPTDEERRHLSSLLRTETSKAARLRYELEAIAAVLLNAGLPADWPTIVEILFGAVPPAVLEQRAAHQAWHDLWAELRDGFSTEAFAGQHAWLEKLRRDAVLRKLPGVTPSLAKTLVQDAVRLLRILPLPTPEPLARVAAHHFGSGHALDPDRPLANLVLRGLAQRSALPTPDGARTRRELWESYGIVCDELSAPVLTLNLRLAGDDALVRLVHAAGDSGQPIHLSTRWLLSANWSAIVPPARVFICENPSVIALAADALGRTCAPLVCVDGEPKTAAWLLLRALRERGSELWYHGDFDWPGVAIAGRIFAQTGARPWRYDAQAYREAAKHRGRTLSGAPQPTPWSPALCEAMQDKGQAYDEESLTDTLLADLSPA